MIQTFSADRADHALNVSTLPRRPPSTEDFFDPHHFELFWNLLSVNPVPISQKVFRRAVERKSFDDLLRGPLCRRMSRNIEVDDASAIMREHDEDEQNLKPERVYREEVDGNELRHVIGKKRSPCLG